MKDLILYPISGLFTDINNIEIKTGSKKENFFFNGKHSLEKINSIFWNEHLNLSKVKYLTELLSERFEYLPCYIPQYQAVKENTELYFDRIEIAIKDLKNPMKSEKNLFSAYETLNILCKMYSDFIYYPFKLTVDYGFLLNCTDVRMMLSDCLNPGNNPYFDFIKKHFWPVLKTFSPELIWIYGPPDFSIFTMALLSKKEFPGVHICIIDDPTEYHSLNKIGKFLIKDHLIFSIIDSICMYHYPDFENMLSDAILKGNSINSVPGILHIDRISKKIKTTLDDDYPYNQPTKEPKLLNEIPPKCEKIDEDNSIVINLKMWPECYCYWNDCNFCGINKKYRSHLEFNQSGNIKNKVDFLCELNDKGYRYFWLSDEAVPPEILNKFSNEIIKRKININWQIRSRIDEGFTQEVCNSLSKAGLKEIRFGLETASYRILKLMNKFSENFRLSLVEKIVSRFNNVGVSVHICLMIDFPGETSVDRFETFDFVENLVKKYPSVTFNMNRFMLDVTSVIYRQYEKFGITNIIWPCPIEYFLGNTIEWSSEQRNNQRNYINNLRNDFTRQNLYPWMPPKSLTSPIRFYVQCETSKMTLIWKTKPYLKSNKQKVVFSKEMTVVKSQTIIHINLNKNENNSKPIYRIYDWNSHNHFKYDEKLIKLFDVFIHPQTIQAGMELFYKNHMCSSLTLEQVFEKYYPELEKAFYLNLLCPTDPDFFMEGK